MRGTESKIRGWLVEACVLGLWGGEGIQVGDSPLRFSGVDDHGDCAGWFGDDFPASGQYADNDRCAGQVETA